MSDLFTLQCESVVVKSKIREFREDAGFTQAGLAKAASISRQAYAAIEAGRSVPSTEAALRLARALHTSVEDLFQLGDDAGSTVQAELVGTSGSVPEGSRMQLIQFGSRRLAYPMKEGASVSHMFNPADGIVVASRGTRQVDLRLLDESATKTQTIVLAGCDPATSILSHMIQDLRIRLVWIEEESMPALHALARGEIHVAGCNFKDPASGVYNVPLVKEIVPFPCTIVRFAVWRHGIMVNEGNPKSIKNVADLVRPNVTFINRRPGAGSRGLLNRLLKEARISADDIHGYDKAVNGHLAAAETVAAGLADCGIGIEAAARANELDFSPLNEEPYDLVIPNHFMNTTAVQVLLDLLKSINLRRQIESLGGYDGSLMGASIS